MSKYHFAVKLNPNIIARMYQDHGYTVEEICDRLRYPIELVKEVIKRNNLQHGKKSWRY